MIGSGSYEITAFFRLYNKCWGMKKMVMDMNPAFKAAVRKVLTRKALDYPDRFNYSRLESMSILKQKFYY